MSSPQSFNENILNSLRLRITVILPEQIRACTEQLDDEQLWWRPNAQSNSAANLILHLAGALQEFICRRIGGFEYARQRDAEFAQRASASKKELAAIFDEAIEKSKATFDALSPARLSAPSTNPDYYSTLYEDLLGAAFHMAIHTGQIVYITKMFKEGAIEGIWAKTHRSSGAWRT
jgi:uncharacterized damage-inducible protein DinB